jgi:septal ring factor EnvC (AmiA/AmiB activator)
MAKEKYIYNPKTLQYEKVPLNRRRAVLNYLGILLFLGLLAGIIYVFASDFLGTSRQQKELLEMHRYYREMQSQMETMKLTLENLNERDAAISKQLMELDPDEFSNLNKGMSSDSLKMLSDGALIEKISDNIAEMRKKMADLAASKDELEAAIRAKEAMLKAVPSIRPIPMPENGLEYLSGFGYRKHPVFKILKMHNGIDFGAEIGTAVYATGKGKVQQIQQKADGYGKSIVIDHGYGFQTLYAHLSEINVKVGEELRRGQIIGRVGNSGGVSPHLHYEVIYKKKRINPLHFCREGMSADAFSRFSDMVSKENQAFSIH